MDLNSSYRPRVSRETRLLLTTGAVAIALLWLLARVRFQDQPVTPNPVPSVLSQLSGGANYETLASAMGDLQARLQPSLVGLDRLPGIPEAERPSSRIVALRWRNDLGIALLPVAPPLEAWPAAGIRALDRASGLAIVRVPEGSTAARPPSWAARPLERPRYVAATDVAEMGVSLRPVFVGSLDPTDSPLWPDTVWSVPRQSDLRAGSFLFTTSAEFVGLVVATGGDLVIVPGDTVLAEAERLFGLPQRPAGTVGLEVQALTAPVAALAGAYAGVVVTWLQPDGPAWGALMVGDVIEGLDGRALGSPQQWDARVSRLSAGEVLALRVVRSGQVHDVSIVAQGVDPTPVSTALGLTLRGQPGAGAAVVRVQPATAADRAGLAAGDVITLFADIAAPTPAQIGRAYAGARQGDRLMVAVTRDEAHRVTVVVR
jgi:hypothetical protein